MSLFVFSNCENKIEFTENLNYVNFQSTPFIYGVDLESTSVHEISIYTTQVTGSDRTFTINVDIATSTADAAAYSVPTTVTVPANSNVGVFSVSITDLNIGEEGKTLVLEIGAQEGLLIGDKITLNIRQVCPYNEVVFAITFDDYPDETSWELFDSNDNVIASGGPYAGETAFAKSFCLENGTYTFTIYDAWGDGSGPYTLTYNGENLVSSDGGFGTSESTTFTVSM